MISRRISTWIFIALLVIAGCQETPPPANPAYSGTSLIPVGTPIPSPTYASSTETPEPSIAAVVKDNLSCASGSMTITISQFAIVSIIARNITSEWGKLRLIEEIVCWVELIQLNLNNQSLEFLPIEDFLPPPTMTPTITPTPVVVPFNTPFPLGLRWKILNYDCLNGRAIGAIVGLDVFGGIPDYKYFPELPIYAQPGQFLSITVDSNTSDGEPSGTISFTLPPHSEFFCAKPGNNEGPNPLPIEPSTNTDPSIPPSEPKCYDQKGKKIQCK